MVLAKECSGVKRNQVISCNRVRAVFFCFVLPAAPLVWPVVARSPPVIIFLSRRSPNRVYTPWFEVRKPETIRRHTHPVRLLWRVISPSQRPMPTQVINNIPVLNGIRTCDPNNRAAADLRLRPWLHWSQNRHNTTVGTACR